MERLSLELLILNEQFINLAILSGAKVEWILTALYASLIEKFRRELWSYFYKLGPCITLPWLLVGDYKHILSSEDKHGGSNR